MLGASSARCASSRRNWNLLPPPHCRAERSQTTLPRPSPARPHSGPGSACSGSPLGAPTPPRACSPAGWAGGGGLRAWASLGPLWRAGGARLSAGWALRPLPQPTLGAPGLLLALATAPRRPWGRCGPRPLARRVCPLVPRASGERRPASPGIPPFRNVRFPPGRVAGFRLSRPGHMAGSTTPSDSVPAKSCVFSTKFTFCWGWLSAFPGRSPRGTGSSS